MKKAFVVTCISVVIFVLVVFLIFFILFGGFNFLIQVPEPKIKHGEFPFKLIYELDGETKIIEDAIVCEFDGFKVIGESGKYRKWKSYLKSGAENLILLNLENKNIKDEFGHKVLEVYFYWGNAEFYMGDNDSGREREAQNFEWIEYKYLTEDGQIGGSACQADEAYKKYKIRLISWEASSPIKNDFR